MTQKQKSAFRRTVEWRALREHIFEKFDGKDAITGRKLCKRWHLHHLDLNAEHYDNIKDEEHFIPLNPKTHDALHFLARYDVDMFKRMEHYLEIMRDLKNKDTN